MKYVLLGNISPEWVAKHEERNRQSMDKAEKLGVKIESLYYTQGQFDFVCVADAPDADSVLSMSIWYADKGFGRIQSMPAFDSEKIKNITDTL